MEFLALAATAIQGWCPWCGGHMGWGGWGMMLFWVILLIGVLAAVWAIFSGRWRSTDRPRPNSAEEMVRQQYARGEIDEETYRRRLEELRRD